MSNIINKKVVKDFGKERKTYSQENQYQKLNKASYQCFKFLSNKLLNKSSVDFDAGCGSGRWSKFIAPKVNYLYCFNPSIEALEVAKRNLSNYDNCSFECVSINSSTIKENIEVACGEGKLLIKNFEVDGKIINPTQIIKSIRTRLK